MAASEPTGYEDEPRECFEELPARLHSRFYHYERLALDLDAELRYYLRRLAGRCTRLLELGCGSCLLANELQENGFIVTSIDLDQEMLRISKQSSASQLAQMDMCALGFQPSFEAVLVAQNTLNLLADEIKIKRCLEEIKQVLIPPGLVLAHLYCTEAQQMKRQGENLLQFSLYDHPEGGKFIKETIRSFDPDKNALLLEQRFKIRRFSSEHCDKNYRSFLHLAALSRKRWIEIFKEAGFTVEFTFSNFSEDDVSADSTLHLVGRYLHP